MFAMFKQLFAAFTLYFVAFEKFAGAVNNVADWTNESTAAFADKARIERAKDLAKMKAQLAAVEDKSKKAA